MIDNSKSLCGVIKGKHQLYQVIFNIKNISNFAYLEKLEIKIVINGLAKQWAI